MNPTPTSLIHWATETGESSIWTPKASRTSALPQDPEAARLPCLATFSPAPAATKAVAVEMLKVFLPSPPVPTVSTNSPSTSTLRAISRITLAMPAISWVVSPFKARAVKNAPSWAGVASPSMISRITEDASSMVSDWPETTAAMDSLIIYSAP